MPALARDAFLDLNRRFNDAIRDVSRALAAGDPPAETILRARLMVESDLGALRALPVDGALPAGDAGKVLNHLDLFLTLTDSIASAPALCRKLLDHLLEEQLEITAGVEKAGTGMGAPPARQANQIGRAALPDGRRPLTVGSLIGR